MKLFPGLNMVSLNTPIAVCVNMIDRSMGNSLALQWLLFLHFEVVKGKCSQLSEKKPRPLMPATGLRISEEPRTQRDGGWRGDKKDLK